MGPGRHRSRSRSPRDREGHRRRDHEDSKYRPRHGEDDRSHERREDRSRRDDDRRPAREREERSHSKPHKRRRASPDQSSSRHHGDRQETHADRPAPSGSRERQRSPIDTRDDAGRDQGHDRHTGAAAPGGASGSRGYGNGNGDARGNRGATGDRGDGGASNSRGGGGGKRGEKEEEGTAHLEARNLERSGKLVEETNTYRGVVIKYSEPDEARKPQRRWRLYPFKGDQQLEVMYIHRQSAYLIGRNRKVCDIPMDHPSISSQHAALQYRLMPYEKPSGATGHRVSPYLIDLDSTNGCFINNQRVDPQRYYELKEQDMLKFGFSSREYVVLHESSKDDDPGLPADDAPVAKSTDSKS